MATNTEKIVVQVVVQGDKDLKKLEGRTKSTTKSFGKMAAGVLGAVAAFRQITTAIGNSLKTFRDFEFQMAKVKAISNASERDFKKLSQTAQDLGRTTFFTATQVAELQTNFAKLGFTTSEILNAQEATLLLATATGTDLGRAAIVAGAAVRGFNLDATETARVVDVMTESFNSSALDIEKFQTSMTKVAPIAASMNIPLEDTTAIMGTLTDAGIEASIAGTSMRNIFLKMKDASSDLSKFLGFTVNGSESLSKALEKLNTASSDTLDSLVNIRQVAAFNVMVKGSERVEMLTKKLNEAEGAAAKASSIIGDTLEGAFKRLTSASQGLSIELVDKLGGGLQDLIDRFANFLNQLTKNSDGIVNFIKNVTKAIKWIGLYKLGTIAYTVAVKGATLATKLFNKSLVFSRQAMARTGVGALVLGLGYLAEKYIFVKDSVDNLTDSHEDYRRELEKTTEAENRLSKALGARMPETLDEVPEALKEANKTIQDAQNKAVELKREHRRVWGRMTAKGYLELSEVNKKEFKKQLDKLKEQLERLLEIENDFEKRKLRIEAHAGRLRLEMAEKAFKDDVDAEKEKNDKLILIEKNKFLNGEISKKQFDKNIETLELNHLKRMKKIHSTHKQSTTEIENEILDKRLKLQEDKEKEEQQREKDNFKDSKLAYEIALQEELNADKENLKNKIIDKEEYDNRTFEAEQAHLQFMKDLYIAYGKDITDINSEILDNELNRIEEVSDAELKAKKDTIARSNINRRNFQIELNLKKDLVNGIKTQEQFEDELLNKQIKNLQSAVDKTEMSGVEKKQVELELYNLKLELMNKISNKEQEAADERIKNGERVLQALSTSSDAIFSIMGNNAQRQASRDEKILEERKDAGLITEQEYEKGVERIQRKAFERKKKMDIAQVMIDTALAVAKIKLNAAVASSNPVTVLFAGISLSQVGLALATGAAQIAVIAAQQFANGGMIEEFANGGMVQGKSHAQGGEKFAVGGRVVELEGGEAVINKRSTSMFKGQLSAINAAGGGVKFADGGLLNMPSFSQQQFNALGQNQMMGAMGGASKVVVVEADITSTQNSVSVIESDAII